MAQVLLTAWRGQMEVSAAKVISTELKMRKTKMNKAVLAVAGLCLASATTVACANGLQFTIQESVATGTPANTVKADRISGSYTELLTTTGGANFASAAYARFGNFLIGGAPVPQVNPFLPSIPGSYLTSTTLPGGDLGSPLYGLYGLFDATGAFSGGTFTGTTSSVSLWLDPQLNTVSNMPVSGSAVAGAGSFLSGTGDDIKIAFSSTLVSGIGVSGVGYVFDFKDVTLTSPNGTSYFVSPNPFYLETRLNGNFVQFTPPAPGSSVLLTGDVSMTFKVPEPAGLGLLGLAFSAAGLAAWRRRKVA